MNEFDSFAIKQMGITSSTLHDYYNYINPMITEERKLNVATMDVFSRLMMERIIWLGSEVDNDVANIIQAQLLFLSSVDNKKDISLYINSPGGLVTAGLGIYDTMQLINPSVSTICTGLAASMGAVLLAGGTKGKRQALKHSRIMIHQPLGGAQGQASNILISAREIEKTRDTLNEILAFHTGNSIDKIMTDTDRDFWMDSKESVEYGIIDKILIKNE